MTITFTRLKKSAVAIAVAATAVTGMTAVPAHADTAGSIVAAVQSQINHGPGSGYSNGAGQTSSANLQPWCADFAGWAWAQGGGVQHLGDLTDGAASFYDYGVRYGTLSSTPHPGDAVVYDYNPDRDWASHVAIVTAVGNGTMTVTGGNEGHSRYPNGIVQQESTPNYSVGSAPWGQRISGYISPVTTGSGGGTAPAVPAKAIRGDKGTVLGTDGTSMTFTRSAANGHLQLTYLPSGGKWATADLTNTAGTPVSAGGPPAAFVQQNGTLGAVTANAANGHLQLTYRSAGGTWATTDLTGYVGTPATDGTYSVITGSDGTLAIYSRNYADGHLQLTYLPTSGAWATTDLTAYAGTPATADKAPAAFALQNGTIGAITTDSSNGHLRLTYRAPSGTWATTDMTGYVGTPATDGAVSAFTGSDGTLAIYSRNSADSHLQLTYIANNSGTWTTTDLTTSVGTPVSAGSSPALFQQADGTLGIVTANAANGHLQMTYRPSSGAWSTIDLTGYAGTPATDGANLSAAFNPDGTLVLYSRNYADGHLQLTYHPTNGAWATTDLTGFVGTPAE
ncbi:CHAP domain-containing protein [Streptomyces sp. 1114.5]|uniref:CHAP domain-containing protein n=1 Tax=Streptomyces sp. 1114.5 TaxID=1938830 RepID=UPI000EB38E48|nr:CHAP domain-containing protein [Streptomyces sp. 1114.5]RKT20165.1 CHAP domain-containing protein [Streptomyces sp. 1114.5]